MASYMVRRLGVTLLQLFVLSVVAFFLIHLAPGNPVQTMLGPRATPGEIALLNHQLGLDRPLPEQYVTFLHGIFTANPGNDFLYAQSIGSLIGPRIIVSAQLICGGLLVAIIIGVPLALISALRANSGIDHSVRALVTLLFAMPQFWVGLILALIFALKLKWLPSSGYSDASIGSLARTMLLPSIALGLSILAVVVRTLRGSVREVLRTEYVTAARARGYGSLRVLFRHVLRNAVMPTTTVLAVNAGLLIGSSVVIEQVFQIPGLGSLLFDAVERRDFLVVEYITLIAGATVIMLTLVVDMAQVIIDPRVNLVGTQSA
jgi:ABC-type dipeptide/oligopeptide/nickel transport system permease component